MTRANWIGGLAIIVIGSWMLAWTWGTWPDVLVDFGDELYTAWQLAEGKRLYADLAYLKGPLSPYVNALLFVLFGTSVRTLIICNAVLLVGFMTLLYHLLHGLSD